MYWFHIKWSMKFRLSVEFEIRKLKVWNAGCVKTRTSLYFTSKINILTQNFGYGIQFNKVYEKYSRHGKSKLGPSHFIGTRNETNDHGHQNHIDEDVNFHCQIVLDLELWGVNVRNYYVLRSLLRGVLFFVYYMSFLKEKRWKSCNREVH